MTLLYRVRLKELRNERDLTLEEVAEVIGVSTSALSGWEHGYRKPNIDVMKKISSLYQTSVDYIIGLTDDKDPKPVTMNAKEFLMKKGLHWDGKHLSDEELRSMRAVLDYMIREAEKKESDQKNADSK